MVVAECGGGFVEAQRDCGNAMMGFGIGNAEVVVVVDEKATIPK